MLELWNSSGFYLWALTTGLVVIALAWLAYNTFSGQGEPEHGHDAPAPSVGPAALGSLSDRGTALAEAAPHMQATRRRSLQYSALARYTDGSGAQAFSPACSTAAGDASVLSSSV